ncbi:hypothetical protein [Ancrocorticia populi]|uniref:hypothetical protein n=1 Tax=Ancrocorticia populi TaxID=2175228 RepID=UPI002356569F|nr:hypothetical protein [Ancrocorticia populi]
MSIPVPPQDLARVAAGYGSATLITLPASGFAKVLTVDPDIAPEGTITIANPSKSTTANLAANSHATLVWQPRERHGWTLIVDGHASLTEEGKIVVVPKSGMLHRPAAHADGPKPLIEP